MGAVEAKICRRGSTDWFRIDGEFFPFVKGQPGVRFDGPGGKPIIHRSHLPLLPKGTWEKLVAIPEGLEPTSWVAGKHRAPGFEPRPHQLSGAAFLKSRHGALLADEQRTGKTLTTILAINLSLGPVVIVAPLQAREVWREWLDRSFPDQVKVYLQGKQRSAAPPEADIVFVHRELLPWRLDLVNLRVGTVVVDEGHEFTNEKAPTTQALLTITAQAQQVFVLTGTPLTNRPKGLYPILVALAPGAFGSFWDFCFRFADAKPNAYGVEAKGASHIDEFKARMTEIMIRRTWADVAGDLPPITRTTHIAPLSYLDEKNLDLEIEEVLSGIKNRNLIGSLTRYRKAVAKLKIPATLDLVATYPDEPVVTWAWHRDVANDIWASLTATRDAIRIDGSHSIKERESRIRQWRTQPAAVLVVTMAVGQVAIDLSHSKRAVFAELDYTPRVISQAEMRTFSPKRPMSVDYVAVDHVVERGLVRALREKLELAAKVGVAAAESALEIVGQVFGAESASDGDFERLAQALEGF